MSDENLKELPFNEATEIASMALEAQKNVCELSELLVSACMFGRAEEENAKPKPTKDFKIRLAGTLVMAMVEGDQEGIDNALANFPGIEAFHKKLGECILRAHPKAIPPFDLED